MCEMQFASAHGLCTDCLTALSGGKHNTCTRDFQGYNKRSNCVWIRAEKSRGTLVIFTFVSLQRPAHLLKIWHWCEASTSRVMKEISPMLLLSFGRLTLRQILGANGLQLLLPHLSNISRLKTLCKTFRLEKSAGHNYCILLMHLPLFIKGMSFLYSANSIKLSRL